MRSGTILLLLALTGCVTLPEPPAPGSFKQLIQRASDERAHLAGLEPWALSSVETFPVSAASDGYVAITDHIRGWWGDWCWFRARHGVIVEIVWGEQMEQSMHSLRGRRDPRFPGVLVEGWGMTHQGNGRYYLFHVHGGAVETLIETRGVDVHTSDGLILVGDMLDATHADYDGDGHGDIVLTGREHLLTAEELGEPPEKCDWTPRAPQVVRKVFAWRPALGRFERLWAAELGAYEFY